MGTDLLERESQLEALAQWWGEARRGNGRLVFVGGEAGVGKTTLLRRFCAAAPAGTQVLTGACEPLTTPVALGPLVDMAPALPERILGLLEAGHEPMGVRRAFLDHIGGDPGGTVVVIEDAHWADEATLDLVRHVGRRLRGKRALVLVTYRDDEVGSRHPLRVAMGDVATVAEVRRLLLAPLSAVAVGQLAVGTGIDAADLYQRSGGNPFFVTEVLAGGLGTVPTSVRDVVLARAARLGTAAREALDAAACLGGRVEPSLLEDVAGEGRAALDECLDSGMLGLNGDGLTFRHELARLAVEAAVSPLRSAEYHARALERLRRLPPEQVEPARLAEHAERAGDHDAVLEYSVLAAERAVLRAAHRQAAAHFGRALAVSAGLTAERRAELLEARAREAFLSHDLEAAEQAWQAAYGLWGQVGNRRRQAQCRLGQVNADIAVAEWLPRAEAAWRDAIDLLDGLPPCPEIFTAYAMGAMLGILAGRHAEVRHWGERAAQHAADLGDRLSYAVAQLWVDLARVQGGDDDAWPAVEETASAALAAPFDFFRVKTHFWPYHVAVTRRRHEVTDHWYSLGLTFAVEHDIEIIRQFFLSYRARELVERGRWDEGAALAHEVAGGARPVDGSKLLAWETLARLAVRRGEPDANVRIEAITSVGDLGRTIVEWLVRAPATLAERAWLNGERDVIEDILAEPLKRAVDLGEPWWLGEVVFWLWRAGHLDQPPGAVAEPYALLFAGRWKEAHDAWMTVGCPYAAAQALASADDVDALRRALTTFERFGAKGERDNVARRLRSLGVRDLPRSGHGQPAGTSGLSRRENEVLGLLDAGFRNAEIADRLFLSERTVEHHVAAILRKLGARSRREAIANARARGLTGGARVDG